MEIIKAIFAFIWGCIQTIWVSTWAFVEQLNLPTWIGIIIGIIILAFTSIRIYKKYIQ